MDIHIKKQLEDTITHKKHVLDSCLAMATYLYDDGMEELALDLLNRASSHDVSKFCREELLNLSLLAFDKNDFKNPECGISDKQRELVSAHWRSNRHHPEHFETYDDMTDLDIIEMVCDWHARSVEHQTPFIDFVKTRQESRFHFPCEMFKQILSYCYIINELIPV